MTRDAPMPEWNPDIPTDGAVELPPDPRALEALGRNHSLPTALADLVDNSVDADATKILIRFVLHRAAVIGLYVVDNGHGIAPGVINTAMTIGGDREYSEDDLGRFGVGLKAASLSQATSVTVFSRAAGEKPVGRRWRFQGDRHDFRCDVVRQDFASTQLQRAWPFRVSEHGTVVRWDEVRAFPAPGDRERIDEFLSRTIDDLRGHLGLMFHRILQKGRVQIHLDVEDLEHGCGLPTRAEPLDPFGYTGTVPGWPKDLTASAAGGQLILQCHIWPRRSNQPEYRLPGGAEERQGLYFYRRDRLLHAGGWEGIHAPDRKLQLARVAINMDGDVAGMFTMNPEKSRVMVGTEFAHAVSAARAADGTTIADYLTAAEETWVRANQRTAARKAVVPPGRGLDRKVARVVREELPQRHDNPLNIQWRRMSTDDLFEVDRETNTLWLNQHYRRALLGGRHGGLNDLPVLKTLLYLLTQDLFQGVHLGSRDKDNMQLWQEILSTAAEVEKATFEARS